MKKFVLCWFWVASEGPIAVIEAPSLDEAVSKIGGKIRSENTFHGGTEISIPPELAGKLGKASRDHDFYVVEVPTIPS